MQNKEQKKIKGEFNLPIIVLLVLSLALCLWGLNFGLPGLFHSDEQALVKRALRFGGGDLNPNFFYYPSLHMYILFIAYGFFFVIGRIVGLFASVQEFAYSYIRDPSQIYIIGRCLSALPTVASVYMTYRIAGRIFGKKEGLLAGLFFIAIPRIPTMSRVIKPDPMMVFFILIFFEKCLDIISCGDKRALAKNSLLAGLFIGLATSCKYNAAPMFLSLVVSCVIAAHRMKKDENIGVLFKDKILVPVALAFVFFVVGFTAGTPYWIIDFTTFKRHLGDMLSYTAGGDMINAQKSLSIFFDGILPLADVCLKELLFLGSRLPFLGLLCAYGFFYFFIRVFRQRDFGNSGSILLMVFSVAMVYFVCARQRIPGWWYLAPAFPLYATLGSGAASELISSKNKFVRWLAIVLVVVALGDALSVSARESYALSKRDVRLEARDWIENNIPPRSKILLDVHGPQILRSRALIQKQYELALKFNNPKKDYFRLQIDAAAKGVEYDFWYIERPATAPKERVQRSREVELFESIGGCIKTLKKKGFQYVILAMPSSAPTEEEKRFDAEAKLLKEFKPEVWLPTHHFRIKIYSIL